jgi:hypothetical protein
LELAGHVPKAGGGGKVGKVGNVTFLCAQLPCPLLLRERPDIANLPKMLAMWPSGFALLTGSVWVSFKYPCNAEPFSANWLNSFTELVVLWIKCLAEGAGATSHGVL